jgi:hypothetical protein
LFAVEAAEGLAVTGFVGAESPGETDGGVDLPVVSIASPHVRGGFAGGGFAGIVAEGGAHIEGGELVFFRGEGVEFELFDGELTGGEVGGLIAGEFVGVIEGDVDGGKVGKDDGAGSDGELEGVDEGGEVVLGVLGGLLGLEERTAGVGDADFGLENVELDGGADLAAGTVFLEEFLGDFEGSGGRRVGSGRRLDCSRRTRRCGW